MDRRGSSTALFSHRRNFSEKGVWRGKSFESVSKLSFRNFWYQNWVIRTNGTCKTLYKLTWHQTPPSIRNFLSLFERGKNFCMKKKLYSLAQQLFLNKPAKFYWILIKTAVLASINVNVVFRVFLRGWNRIYCHPHPRKSNTHRIPFKTKYSLSSQNIWQIY